MRPLAAIFALLVAAAGWFYMFYSRAAHNLTGIENEEINLKRIRLRRIGGFVMFLLAIFFFAGFWTVDATQSAQLFMGIWLAVFILLGVIVLLGLIDLRLTWKLRDRRKGPR